MEVIRNATLIGKTLSLDDKHLIDCSLMLCVLEYRGGDFALERTELKGCRHIFYGPSRATVHYLQTVGLLANDPALWAELSDEVH